MGLFSFLDPSSLLGGGGGGGGSTTLSGGGAFNKESSNVNESTTHNQSNSGNYTLGNGASYVGDGGTYDNSTHSALTNWITDQSFRDYSDRSSTSNNTSFQVNDSSSRDYSQAWNSSTSNSTSFRVDDSSSHSSVVNNNGTDAAQIVALNAGFLGAANERQNETVRLMAQMGYDSLGKASAAATDLFATGSANASAAWGHTVDTASELLQSLITTTRSSLQSTTDAAQAVASRSIASTPDNLSATNMRLALLAVAAVVVLPLLFKRS